MPTLDCKFGIGDRVHIDTDLSITAVVMSIEWKRPDVVRYELSWLCNGDAKFIIFDEWRLSPAEAR